VIAAGIVAYLGSFRGVFLFDDVRLIVENPNLRRFATAWASLPGDDRPLVTLSLAVNYAISGLNVWSYHAFNLSIHLLAALTLFGVVAGTLRLPGFPDTTRDSARGFGFVVALLWVLHPLQTASVSYVIQRGESMMGLFYLLTLYCVIRGSGAKRPGPWHGAAVAACALGMGSKAIMVSAPILVLLYDRVFLSRSMAELIRRRWALHAALFGTLALLGATGIAGIVLNPTPRQNPTVGFGYAGSTPLEYALTQPGVILHYLRLSLWPVPLCLDYSWPLAKHIEAVVLPLLLIGALLAGTIASFWRWPRLGFAGAWFFLVLAPTSSFIPLADAAFEHRMYLPLAAVIVMVAAAVRWLLGRAGGRLHWPRAALRTVLVASVLLASSACGAVTIRRQRDYQSSRAMWENVLHQRPASPRAHNGVGLALAAEGRLDEAALRYREAIRLKNDYAEAHNNLGRVLRAQGKLDEAILEYREAIRWSPALTKARYNLGNALVAAGRLDEAILQYREAIRLDPNDVEAHNNLGIAFARRGNLVEAISQYRDALRLDADFVEARTNLGGALAAQGRLDEGMAQWREAIRRRETCVEAHTNLGMALTKLGRFEEAIPELRRALELDPGNATAGRHLAAALQEVGRPK
jgi:tetratricopeptide (TPR) repeat protein